MKKRKVFIMAYARVNLGDDLFVIELLEKYRDIEFYISVKKHEYAKAFEKYKNLTILESNEENFDNKNPKDYDAYVYVGGSIFMEGGKVYNLDEGCNTFMKKCNEENIPFFYVSSNYGPYQTKEYFDLSRDTFKYCKDICFRDTYSYELFKDIPTVRYAPDLIFSLEKEDVQKENDSVGISIIDMSIREKLAKYEKQYNECMVYNIIKYIKQGKKVYLFSFCKEEYDEKAIENILERIPEKYRTNIYKVYYDGNMDEYIKKYKSMEYMICCRFHAMILSVAFNQKMYILSYSKKIDNVIKDLELVSKYTRIEEIKEDMDILLQDVTMVEVDKTIKLKKESKKQLDKIEEWYNAEVIS